jgi:RNA polymerase sigma-70 factor (ECF subfamily)
VIRGRARTVTTARSDDLDLIRRIRAGDREALGELYDRYAGIAMAVAVRTLQDRAAAEDVVHDAFVAVWDKMDRFDPERGSLRSWLLTIVRNRAIDRIRRTRSADDVSDLDARGQLRTTPNPTWEAAAESLDRESIAEAVAALPVDQREAVELAYFGGNTYRQVAELTGVSPGTAASRLRLALARLRASLGTGP